MITRRNALAGAAAALTLPLAAGAQTAEAEPPVDADGLYTQAWFHTSFLDMREDLADAAAQDKHLMVLWEQRGCPYCRELHRVNFAQESIRQYLQDNYLVVQLNLWGDRAVTDFDGKTLPEKQMARKWFVTFTPTVQLINARDAGAPTMIEAEAFRMPGYFKPFHFLSGLEYAAGDKYRDEHFQRWLSEKADRMRAEGKPVELWQ